MRVPRSLAGPLALAIIAVAVWPGATAEPVRPVLDAAADRWVAETLKALTVDEKVGQLIVASFESRFLSTDSDGFDDLLRLVRDYHIGGLHVFGASEPVPPVLLNPTYGTVTLGEPFAVASALNRLQAAASVPLLNSADFEAGAGFRISGATTFPRQMALGAAGDEQLVREAARITGLEARAMGVQVNFAPIADVNNNARNPVINTRSYGEDPARVGALVSAYVEGARQGGVIATLKHFPGHGDTDIDSHLGLPIVAHSRERLDSLELVPFRAGLAHGAGAVMVAHIQLPALDPTPATPATFSAPIIDGLLRRDLAFGGLVYTDSMSMDAVVKLLPPGEAAVRAILAGADQVLHSPDPIAAFSGLKDAVSAGRISQVRLDESVERILRAKAAVGLDKSRSVDLDSLPARVGGRAHEAIAALAATRSITLIKDDRHEVPLGIPGRTGAVSLDPRRSLGMADRRAEPHVHPGVEETLADGHLDRAVRSHAGARARPRPRHRSTLRRHHRVGVREDGVGQRTHGPGAAAGAAAERSRANDRSQRDDVRDVPVRQPIRRDRRARACRRFS